jgi:hypothetical protein
MSVQHQVDNPMWWFDEEVITEDFIRGYSQAVYQIRLKLVSMKPEPEGIRAYTEFMLDELNKIIHDSRRKS